MNVLFAAAEGVPFSKTGGLADVIGALPKELKNLGINVAVVLPKYGDTPKEYAREMELVHRMSVQVGWRNQYCGVLKLVYDDVPFYFIDNESHFKRPGTYGFFDDGERFSFFNRAILEALPFMGFQPDLIHCHDWHTGMLPVMLTQYRNQEFYSKIKTIFTIHNLQYQGVFPKSVLGDLLGLGWEHFNVNGVEFHDQVSFMKGGLNYANALTTVSPTYAQEIQYPFYGADLEGVLARRQSFLSGILNGIDTREWNPQTDLHITRNYSWRSWKRKEDNKLALQAELGLKQDADIPMIGMVTRLAKQKGLDLVAHVLPEILELNLQIVVLGTGEAQFEEMFRHFAGTNKDKVSANIKFENVLAHKIYAASDLFLMPSLFEPCGLGQMIAMRYGSLPIVRETGGLKDTVEPYNEVSDEGLGFSFANYNAHELLDAVRRAISLYERDKDGAWKRMVGRAMRSDFSWGASALKYKELYEKVSGD
ncbi:MAG: glycogen synthase GlgA [Firmicutes bacterium]|nr:glycogen synthase GlgA [Bacillota bacterium]